MGTLSRCGCAGHAVVVGAFAAGAGGGQVEPSYTGLAVGGTQTGAAVGGAALASGAEVARGACLAEQPRGAGQAVGDARGAHLPVHDVVSGGAAEDNRLPTHHRVLVDAAALAQSRRLD